MLYVRYVSGWSRRVISSAARPSAARSRDSNNCRPSVGVKRSPATALASKSSLSVRATMCEKIIEGADGLLRRESAFHAQFGEPSQAGHFFAAERKVQIVSQIS